MGGMAVAAIGNALGLSEATQDSVKSAIMGMTAEQSIALKTADMAFREHMTKLGYENVQALEKIAADDRGSARAMQVSVRSNVPAVLAILVTCGFFGMLAFMMSGDYKPADNQALLILIGSLGTAWTGIIAYYFGSSAGSARKTEILGDKEK